MRQRSRAEAAEGTAKGLQSSSRLFFKDVRAKTRSPNRSAHQLIQGGKLCFREGLLHCGYDLSLSCGRKTMKILKVGKIP